jgi:hypothetical protein
MCCLVAPNNTICANFYREADYKFCGAFSKATARRAGEPNQN